MSDRLSISKKIRFEVFKRDSFICQYCGKSSPNVVLEVDHIQPVSKGGNNNLLNLITSCYDCNRGKTNIELRDDSVVTKQRQQLEMLQERREQINLMFAWRNELDNLKNDTDEMIITYIENKIQNLSLNADQKKLIPLLTKKYGLADILESVDLSASVYLKYQEGRLEEHSIKDFLEKLGGILFNKNRSLIDQKISYIKGICKNKFQYWNAQTGSIILNNFVQALKDYGCLEKDILQYLETKIIPQTKLSRTYSDWRDLIEKWTSDVNNWGKNHKNNEESREVTIDELNEIVQALVEQRKDILPAVIHIGKVFDNFRETELLNKIDSVILNYLINSQEYYSKSLTDRGSQPSYMREVNRVGLFSIFTPVNSMLTFHLENAVTHILRELFSLMEDFCDGEPKSEYFEYMAEKFHYLIWRADKNPNVRSSDILP
jgi:hypothetical protein